jgi:hypothetical protein
MLVKKENNINKIFEIEVSSNSYRILKCDIIKGYYQNIEIGNFIETESHKQAIEIGYSLEEQMKGLGYVDAFYNEIKDKFSSYL